MHLQTLTVEQFKTLLQDSLKPFLDQMKIEIQESSKEESNLVNIKEVMEKLQVTKPTIYNWLNSGKIKCQKIGGKVFYDLPAILKDMKTQGNKFGKGRNYLYKSSESPNQETKEDRKFSSINWKKMANKPLTDEEEDFYNNYKKFKK